MVNDLRYALRLLRRSPGFAATAIVTLGLGLGATTALFSVVDAALLKPLPYQAADRLVDIMQVQRKGSAEETAYSGMTRAEIEQWRTQRALFDGIEPYTSPENMVLGGTNGARPIRVASLSPGMIDFLGVRPDIGRGFGAEEAAAGRDRVVILSATLWAHAFAADPAILGRDIVLDGARYAVIGVMPPDFRFPNNPPPDAWKPLTSAADPSTPGSAIVGIVARLQPSLTLERAEPLLQQASTVLERVSPRPEGWAARLEPSDARGRAGTRNLLLVLLGAVGFVVLIACANLANLQLSRALDRRRELAVRAALGATRADAVRLLLAESLLVSGLGGVAALAIAWWIIHVIPSIVPPQVVFFGAHAVALDWRVFGFAAAATLVVGLAAGIVPAVQGTKASLSRDMASTRTAGATQTRRRAQNLFLAGQVAVATVLLAGAGLMTVSLIRLVSVDPGYDADRLVAVTLALPRTSYPLAAQQQAFFDRLVSSLKGRPVLKDIAFGSLPSSDGGGRFIVEGRENAGAARVGSTAILYADPGYFHVLGIPLLRGRAFDATDRANTPPVAIIGRDAANTFWPGQDPTGKRFRYSPFVDWITVVGVAGDIKSGAAASGRRSFEVFLPLAQNPSSGRTLIARAAGASSDALSAMTAQMQSMDPNVPVLFAGAVADSYGRQLASPRFLAALYWVFAALGLLTAAVGLHGTLAYGVSRRTAELGIRMALGASGSTLRRMVTMEGLQPVAIGLVCGIVAAQWLTRLLASQLHGVTPHDPATYGGVVIVLLAVAAVAAYLPARRASRVDPMVALRAE